MAKLKPKKAHGGRREGAGRKKKTSVAVTVYLHPATIALLEGYGDRSVKIEEAILDNFEATNRHCDRSSKSYKQTEKLIRTARIQLHADLPRQKREIREHQHGGFRGWED